MSAAAAGGESALEPCPAVHVEVHSDVPLPLPGVINASDFVAPDFDMSQIIPETHLFFDDDVRYSNQVQKATPPQFNLKAVFCRPQEEFSLYSGSGEETSIHEPGLYRTTKMKYIHQQYVPLYRMLDTPKSTPSSIGTGLTCEMISRLIEFEHAETRTGCYFFDFDKTVTYVAGTCFNFIPQPPQKENKEKKKERNIYESGLVKEYARYLVSNYVNEEPAVEPARRGRMQLLQHLFDMIGPDRLYIVTANPNACPDSSALPYFIMTIQVLLPSFHVTHLISANPNCKPSMYPNKGVAISDILSKLASTGRGGAAKPKNKRKPKLSHRRSQSRGVVSRKKQYRQRRFSRTMRHRRK
jgi:hypothetical protein